MSSGLLKKAAQNTLSEVSRVYCTEVFSRTCSLCSRLNFSLADLFKRKLLACITLLVANRFGYVLANGSANLMMLKRVGNP